MTVKNVMLSIVTAGAVLLVFSPLLRAGFHDKKEARIEESAKPKSVSGGVKFEVQKPYDVVYEVILNFLKRADYNIESASKEIGQIITAMTVTGGYSQTGSRVYATLIKDGDAATTVKISVAEQKRKKLLTTEPWGEPKVNDAESQKIADQVRSALAEHDQP